MRRRPLKSPAVEAAEALRAFLPVLDARLRGAILEQLAGQLLRLLPPRYNDPSPLPEVASLLPGLMAVARALEAERDEQVTRLDQAAAVMSRAPTPAARRDALASYLQDKGFFKRWSQRRALGRYFGLDTVRQRYQKAIVHCDIQVELCLKLIEGAACQVLERLPEKSAATLCMSWLKDMGIEGFLLRRYLSGREDNRLAAFHALSRLVAFLPPQARTELLGAQTTVTLFARCRDAKEDRWIQLAAAELLAVHGESEVLPILSERLLHPPDDPDDFIVRRGFVRIIGEHFRNPEGFAVLRQLAFQQDKSEAVRMALVESLARYPGREAARTLAGFESAGRFAEGSPRVRATVALAWADWLSRGDEGDRVFAGDGLFKILLEDPQELPRRVALEEALAAASPPDSRAELLAPSLQEALRRRLARPGISPRERTRLATALEQLDILHDPALRKLYERLEAPVQRLALGRSLRLPASEVPSQAALGRVLAFLARDDFGLYAQATRRGFRITRGEIFTRRLWRVLHEARHRVPNKRQGHVHTVGRHFSGELRAHPGTLAEITATAVPGERLFVEREGGWARYLPLVEDFVDTPLLGRRAVTLYSSEGVTELVPPSSLSRRLLAQGYLARRYEHLSDLRRRALTSVEPEEQVLYLQTMRSLGFQVRFLPHAERSGGALPLPGVERLFRTASVLPFAPLEAQQGGGRAIPLLGVEPALVIERWRTVVVELLVRLSGDIFHLALFVIALLLFLLLRSVKIGLTTRAARARIPLVVGGWGTRGKSGTERLKAALFHGMGYEVLVKTTGCEAMVIHALPERRATEILLYRPYDKASIWEQQDCLLLASQLGVQVFLYECMALQQRYVEVIQQHWSRDDLTTLTNAYPDHEDIHGPTGMDVAWSIATFIREHGTVFTSEQQMLPVLREVARVRQASLKPIPITAADLLPRDFLDRFPYQEHPQNIALVLGVARHLGVDPDRALVEMADKVVPDIGVLKAYPWTTAWRRHLQFVSGNSANERTGFMSNWQRMGFQSHDPSKDRGQWLVTIVNNRADRVARSQVFADILVRDVAAHRHILIGTNLRGLMGYLGQSLERLRPELTLLLPEDVSTLSQETADRRRGRFRRFAQTLKLPVREGAAGELFLDGLAVRSELQAWLEGLGWLRAAEALAQDQGLNEALDNAVNEARGGLAKGLDQDLEQLNRGPLKGILLNALEEAVKTEGEEALPPRGNGAILSRAETLSELVRFTLRSLARMRRMAPVQQALEAALAGGKASPHAINEAFQHAWLELFYESVLLVEDAEATGDQIIRYVASSCPPGVKVRMMGTQNIKGTGLDFVYRWVSIEAVGKRLTALGGAGRHQAAGLLTWLQDHPDYGFLDASAALETLQRLKSDEAGTWIPVEKELDKTITHLTDVVKSRQQSLERQTSSAMVSRSPVVRFLEWVLEPYWGIRREQRAARVTRDLIAGHISHERAAQEMRRLDKEQKGGWLLKLGS